MNPFFLLAIGLLLIFLEIFLPGMIVGAIGGAILLVSIVFFAIDYSFGWTLLYTAGVAVVVLALVFYTLRRIRKGNGIYLSKVQEGYFASSYPKELVGKKGEASSDLKPAGHILVEGKRYQALSKMGYIEKGTPIEVISGEGAHLVVKELKE